MRILIVTALLFLSAVPAHANSAIADRYLELLNFEEVFDVLRNEGITAGTEIAEEDPALAVTQAWTSRLDQIYAYDRMEAVFRGAITAHPDLEGSSEALEFFAGDLGQRLVDAEITARIAMSGLDRFGPKGAVLARVGEGSDRFVQYDQFISVNDLIESNISGTLNSNLAFYRGLSTSEIYQGVMTESFILSEVWKQEPEIRSDTENWVWAFVERAYKDFSVDEMTSYVEMSASESGKRFNTVLFAGFDEVFSFQNFELGRAMAEFMEGENL